MIIRNDIRNLISLLI